MTRPKWNDRSSAPLIRRLARDLAEGAEGWAASRDRVRAIFDDLADDWEARMDGDHVAPLEAALGRVASVRLALDVGTGTGLGARLLAARFPAARVVVGADLAPRMARAAAEAGVRAVVADTAALPFRDGAFDLVVELNMFMFWAETHRVLAPGGVLVVAFSWGEATRMFVPADEIRARYSALGDYAFDDGRAASGTWVIARKRA